MKRKLFFIFLLGVAVVTVPQLSAQSKKRSGQRELQSGTRVTDSLEIRESYVRYQFSVPVGASAVKLDLENAQADLDLIIKRGEDIYFSSETDDFNESVFLSRMSDPVLQDGTYTLDVVYQLSDDPIINGVRSQTIGYSLGFEIIESRVDAVLYPDRRKSFILEPADGMFRTFVVDVPLQTETLRVDLFNASGDLDLFIRYDGQIMQPDDADYKSQSLLSTESIIITSNSPKPLQAGRYFIMVTDQINRDQPESFTIVVSNNGNPPEDFLKIPPIPIPSDPMENALRATVEIIAGNGGGSGCLVGQKGYILTNWHVVRGNDGMPEPDLAIGINLDYERPPKELFKGEVLRWDEDSDIALIKIISGLYGQPIPDGFSFPVFHIGNDNDLKIGEHLGFLGYPGIGGTGSRVSITFSRGVVSGFERTYFGRIIKTDGDINEGNSGGAAMNSRFELIGMPTQIVGTEGGHVGFIHPLTLIPREWWTLIQ